MKKKIARAILSIFLNLLSFSAFANCPDPKSLVVSCTIIAGGQEICQWGNKGGFWWGNSVSGGNVSEMPVFVRAYWEGKASDPQMGSIVCFYQISSSTTGNEIRLEQNIWGGILYPHGPKWRDGTWEGRSGRECTESASACKFAYPPSL